MTNKTKRLASSLADKNAEPLIIRKYMKPFGFPVYVALICGGNLNDLDEFFIKMTLDWSDRDKSIQSLRNYFAGLSNLILDHYKKVEGVAVIAFADKMVISSLWGDFMCHEQCRLELFTLLNMTTQV